MSHLTDAHHIVLNSRIREAVQRDLVLRWRRVGGAFHIVELVSVYSKLNGTERTRVLYSTGSPYGSIAARTITDKVRALVMGARINDPEPIFQQQREEF